MKKLSLLIALMMSVSVIFTACGDKETPDADPNNVTTSSVSDKVEKDNDFGKASYRYVYNNSTDEEKYLYKAIYEAVFNFQDEVVFDKEYDGITVVNAYENVYFQEPELFWFRGEVKNNNVPMSRLSLTYWCSKEEMPEYKKQIEAAADKIIAEIPEGANDFEKLLSVHDHIAKFATFEKNTDFNSTTLYGPLVTGPTQCEAYAKATTYMASKLNIPSMRMTGFNSNQMTHAWNKVQLDGKWYNFDLTWDDPAGNPNPDYFIHNYFLLPDADIENISHFPSTVSVAPPVADSMDMNYFVVKGLYAKTADEAISMLEANMKEAVKTKAPGVQIRCETKEVYDQVIDSLIAKTGILGIIDSVNAEAENKITSPSNASDERLNIVNIKFKYE